MKLPRGGIKAQIERKMGRRTKEIVRAELAQRIDRAQRKALREFEKHPITKEIEGGSFDSGGVLPYGNLYSFIGFESNPIPTIRNILEQNPRISLGRKIKSTSRFRFIVTIPSIEDIYEITPIPDGYITGRSWVQLMERGIPTLNNYLFSRKRGFSGSRSSTGIQTDRGGRKMPNFSNAYIRSILGSYESDIAKQNIF